MWKLLAGNGSKAITYEWSQVGIRGVINVLDKFRAASTPDFNEKCVSDQLNINKLLPVSQNTLK